MIRGNQSSDKLQLEPMTSGDPRISMDTIRFENPWPESPTQNGATVMVGHAFPDPPIV